MEFKRYCYPWPAKLTTDLACVYLGGISRRTLERFARRLGVWPHYFDGVRVVLWPREQLDRMRAEFVHTIAAGDCRQQPCVPWPELLRTPLALAYCGGISESTLRRLARKANVRPCVPPAGLDVALWSRAGLDRIVDSFQMPVLAK